MFRGHTNGATSDVESAELDGLTGLRVNFKVFTSYESMSPTKGRRQIKCKPAYLEGTNVATYFFAIPICRPIQQVLQECIFIVKFA